MSLKLQAPWITFYDKVRELFKLDDEIKISFNDETNVISMYVNNARKAEALRRILPEVKTFGNVSVCVNIVPCDTDPVNLRYVEKVTIEDAFEGNPLYHYCREFGDAFMSNPITYVVFAKQVIQYWNDDLGDLFGNANCLPEDLARDVLVNTQGYFFSTDIV